MLVDISCTVVDFNRQSVISDTYFEALIGWYVEWDLLSVFNYCVHHILCQVALLQAQCPIFVL